NVFDPKNAEYQHMEECAFAYQKIVWTHETEGKQAEDDWRAPGEERGARNRSRPERLKGVPRLEGANAPRAPETAGIRGQPKGFRRRGRADAPQPPASRL